MPGQQVDAGYHACCHVVDFVLCGPSMDCSVDLMLHDLSVLGDLPSQADFVPSDNDRLYVVGVCNVMMMVMMMMMLSSKDPDGNKNTGAAGASRHTFVGRAWTVINRPAEYEHQNRDSSR